MVTLWELGYLVLGAVGGCTLGTVAMAMLVAGNRSALGPRERKVLDRPSGRGSLSARARCRRASVSDLTLQVLDVLTTLHPAHATTGTVTRRLGGWAKVDGREVRVSLDQVVESGQAVYLSGAGNNRSYRLAERGA